MHSNLKVTRLVVAAFLSAWAAQAWALAITPLTQIFPAPTVANAIVRVSDAVGLGSGTVIDVRPTPGGGGWLCVLTADHVIAGGPGFSVDFGNAGGGGVSFTSGSTTITSFRGPLNGDGTRVDLGMLGVFVPSLAVLPAMTLPTLVAAANGTTIDVAGYGLTATLDGPGRRYLVNEGTYGNLLASFNGIDDHPVFTSGIYSFTSIHATTFFGPPVGTAIQAEAHLLNGDSGGPSWTLASAFDMVGVHSHSVIHGAVGSRFVNEGDDWWDVSVADYTSWITTTCGAVPEPSILITFSTAVVLFVFRRRRS